MPENQYSGDSRGAGGISERKTGLIRSQTATHHPFAAISLSGLPVRVLGFAEVEGKSPCLWIVNERTGEIDYESARFFRVIDTNLVPTQTVLDNMARSGNFGSSSGDKYSGGLRHEAIA